MVIQIDGGSSNNKGAQLMLHACLLAIREKHPEATVFLNNDYADVENLTKLYGLNIKKRQSNSWRKFVAKTRLSGIFNKLMPSFTWYFSLKIPVKGVDMLLNIGGFQFGDQWNHSKQSNKDWERYLSKMHKYGTRIIFMPQAFGPFEKEGSRAIVKILDKYSNLLIARDPISMEYLKRLGINKTEIVLYPDFTNSVKGISCCDADTKGGVCFIPNSKMIAQKVVNEDEYVSSMAKMIERVFLCGRIPFLLNHEGSGDLSLCHKIKTDLHKEIIIINPSDALSTKGFIADSYLVVSSRFHGAANALNSSVPCLATSWSHKYQMLFKDYGCEDNILDLSDFSKVIEKIDNYLNPDFNMEARRILTKYVDNIKTSNRKMWNKIWCDQ